MFCLDVSNILDVSKVDLGVAHVCKTTHVCFKCFRHTLRMFHMDIFSKVDLGVAHVANGYTCMFQSQS